MFLSEMDCRKTWTVVKNCFIFADSKRWSWHGWAKFISGPICWLTEKLLLEMNPSFHWFLSSPVKSSGARWRWCPYGSSAPRRSVSTCEPAVRPCTTRNSTLAWPPLSTYGPTSPPTWTGHWWWSHDATGTSPGIWESKQAHLRTPTHRYPLIPLPWSLLNPNPHVNTIIGDASELPMKPKKMVKLEPHVTTYTTAASRRLRAHGPKMARVSAATAVMLEENTDTTVRIGQDAKAMVLSVPRARDARTTEKAHARPRGMERGAHEGRKGAMGAGGGTGNGPARRSLH